MPQCWFQSPEMDASQLHSSRVLVHLALHQHIERICMACEMEMRTTNAAEKEMTGFGSVIAIAIVVRQWLAALLNSDAHHIFIKKFQMIYIALFWGIDYYNKELLQADDTKIGSVSTEILLLKDPNSFTLRNGWASPRRIYFNGENCQTMPLPDSFPMLSNGSSSGKPIHQWDPSYFVFRMVVGWI